MSIVAASGVLSIEWSEFSVVAYPASQLGDMSAMIDEVAVMVMPGKTISSTTRPSDANVARWILRAKQELAEIRQFEWRRRHVTATLTSGYRFSLPPDYGGGYVKIRNTTTGKALTLVSNNLFDRRFPDPSQIGSTGVKLGTIKNMELWVYPPAGGDVLEMEYDRTGDDITSDVSWLPEIERFRCCDFATHKAFYSLHQYEEGDRYFNLWQTGLRKASNADGKRKWSQMGYTARSYFQA